MKMFIKVTYFLVALFFASGQKEDSEWDIAVAINDQVELLTSNGSFLGSAVQQFSNLKALTFDSIRHEFVVSDTDQKNDTIYSVQLTKQTDITPIVQDLPDDVQGLAIDPITDILYWTDTVNRSINYVSLQDPEHISKVLLEFPNAKPQDIAIDVCRRHIYWTNSDLTNPTIERATLDGKNHEVLITDDLFMPRGIAIDHMTQRIIWADKREGIYYRIESSKFDGSDRQVVFEGTHQKPFGIAVDRDAVYWTDTNNNALWKRRKMDNVQPEKLRHFSENPMGVITKNLNIKNISECNNFKEALENYNGTTKEYIEVSTKNDDGILECFNGGELIEKGCKCSRGFTGLRCEISSCYNFCLHGNCYFTSLGNPQCRCPIGYSGFRCEKDLCDGLCLNGGRCIWTKNITKNCDCPNGFIGDRCETSRNPAEICSLFCRERVNDALVDQSNTFICRCEQGTYTLLENQEDLSIFKFIAGENWNTSNSYYKDTVFIILSIFIVVAFMLVGVLSICICRLRRRPRIKKRIIVNKNITPLTYRPQPTTQQCEITIENCCNMNVCETPCFEPPDLRGFHTSRKDEKKTLLANMEHAENLY